ncbi:hypothetical protein MUP77_01330 [Candidatus Bathyarchaeota archaeon]|nr:hypothetical protein [Candidatus Bathyarchaeota archaeon]
MLKTARLPDAGDGAFFGGIKKLRKRRVRFIAKVFGMTMPVGVVKVATLAWEREADTALYCPQCGNKVREGKKEEAGTVVEHSQEYLCP